MLKALTNVRKEARSWTDSFGNLVSSPSSSSMFGEPPKDAEKASPASGGLSDASYDSDDDQGCCARHFGTDALLGSWCLAVASALYALYGLDLVVDSWDSDDVTWVTFAWARGARIDGAFETPSRGVPRGRPRRRRGCRADIRWSARGVAASRDVDIPWSARAQ